uniref:Uncharacterized protein n=1 Tax=Oryza barthii TaxID=65489 RepID=A0A0D3H5I7_9ORYZ
MDTVSADEAPSSYEEVYYAAAEQEEGEQGKPHLPPLNTLNPCFGGEVTLAEDDYVGDLSIFQDGSY